MLFRLWLRGTACEKTKLEAHKNAEIARRNFFIWLVSNDWQSGQVINYDGSLRAFVEDR